MMYNELLWVFAQLPDNYIVLDTETTGLSDEQGLPDIVTLGIATVNNRAIVDAVEFAVRPDRHITKEAELIHGISNLRAASFERFDHQWQQIVPYMEGQLVVIHNANFDWPIFSQQVARYQLAMPMIRGVFCSQKAAIPWAQANRLACSDRGPSLATLTVALAVRDYRAENNEGKHGAKVDSQQTAEIVEAIRKLAISRSRHF
jgi:DNA polymerase III subunit epsilon